MRLFGKSVMVLEGALKHGTSGPEGKGRCTPLLLGLQKSSYSRISKETAWCPPADGEEVHDSAHRLVRGKKQPANLLATHHSYVEKLGRGYDLSPGWHLSQRHVFDVPALTRHYSIQSEEKPHRCEVCGSSFAYPSELARHRRVHTGEKPHKCELCGAAFSTTVALTRHRRIHAGEKPHACETCGIAFSQKANLKRHMAIHTRV